MYTVSKGPSKIVAKTRRGISQNLERFENLRELTRKSEVEDDHEATRHVPKPVFHINGKSKFSSQRHQMQEVITPQHEELIKFVYESWNQVNTPQRTESMDTSECTESSNPNSIVYYNDGEPNDILQVFVYRPTIRGHFKSTEKLAMTHERRNRIKHRIKELWNENDEALDNHLKTIAALHSELIHLAEYRTILRNDYNDMPEKVKLISGGTVGYEPACTGFVGPGMLTAAIVGTVLSAPSCGYISKIIEKLGMGHSPGVLLIVENDTGSYINFTIAKNNATSIGIDVRMIVVESNVCSKPSKKMDCKCGLAGMLFVWKIAGAMAEERKKLDDIYNICHKIVKTGEIASICACLRSPLSGTVTHQQPNPEEIKWGDPQISLAAIKSTARVAIDTLLSITIKENEYKTYIEKVFSVGDFVAVIVNNLEGFSQLECNIFTFEIMKQLHRSCINVERVYVGSLITALDTDGLQVSLLKADNPELFRYLDTDTLAPAWPKPLNFSFHALNEDVADHLSIPNCIPFIRPKGPLMDESTGSVFLTVITYACEALIACKEQLNIMDEDCGDGDCGTTISLGATAIKLAIKENQINGIRPFVTFLQMSHIIAQKMGGVQGGLYSVFFNAVAQVFSAFSETYPLTAKIWQNCLIAGNKAIAEIGEASVGDRTMLDPLIAAQSKLEETMGKSYSPILAFGEAVKSAENCAINTLNFKTSAGQFKYPDPGAHAVGIWMRAAYEGVKLKLSAQWIIQSTIAQ